MKEFLQTLLSNEVLVTGAISWLAAQVLKTIIHAITHKTLDWHRLFGDGGMPSGHSATVTSIALSIGFRDGFHSSLFALAFFVAIIVMHDAMGVRLETGKHAKQINELVAVVYNKQLSNEEKFKEFVGHTPLQVVMGFLLGLGVTLLIHYS